MIYNQFSKTVYTHQLMVFNGWIRMVINEVLWIIFTYSCFISGDINLEKVIFVQNPTIWVKCIQAHVRYADGNLQTGGTLIKCQENCGNGLSSRPCGQGTGRWSIYRVDDKGGEELQVEAAGAGAIWIGVRTW